MEDLSNFLFVKSCVLKEYLKGKGKGEGRWAWNMGIGMIGLEQRRPFKHSSRIYTDILFMIFGISDVLISLLFRIIVD